MKKIILGILIGLAIGTVGVVYAEGGFVQSAETRFQWFTVTKVWDPVAHTDCYVVQSNISGNSSYSTSIDCITR